VYADGGVDTFPPAEYAAVANQFISQLRAVDPPLKLSIPMRSDTLNGHAVVTKPGYLATVLAQVTEPFQLASIHDGYLPLDLTGMASPTDLYLSTVAGPTALGIDLDGYRTQLDQAFGAGTVRFALTEWHDWITAAFLAAASQNPPATQQQLLAAFDEDMQANSIAGAIYTADVLRMLAYRTDVELTNFDTAANNYVFGAVNTAGIVRAPGLALEAASQVIAAGQLLAVAVDGGATLSTPSVGLVQAFSALPAVGAMAAVNAGVTRLLLTNKDPVNPAALQVVSSGGPFTSVHARSLTATDPLGFSETVELAWTQLSVDGGVFTLPPHSLGRVDCQ
jgi:alpha-N-arabinofuranosidase